MTAHKDVILALLGASAGLAGLVLVFLGFLVTAFRTFPADTGATVTDPHRDAALYVVGAFGLAIITVGLATWWLVLVHPPNRLYVGTIAAFFAQLVALTASMAAVLKRLIWE